MSPVLASLPTPAGLRQHLDESFVRRVRELLAGRYGYAPRDAALPHMIRVVETRRGALAAEDYWTLLQTSDAADSESRQLLEDLLNHETEFGRTPPHFAALRETILPALLRARAAAEPSGRRIRLASLGCSTGEEAYTLAATAALLTRPAPPPIEVVGLDLSRRALATARAATYRADALRELDASTRDFLFEPRAADATYRVRPALAERVRFAPHNLLTPLPLAAVDVIFCRNVLIYFGAEHTRLVLGHIRDALAAGGWLFLGHAESALAQRDWFEPVSFPDTLVYRRR
ncbi:MAG: hypothetical protein RLZZ15_297 [Verrucomicrobiota bacterium]